jgi:sugar lactone lactonase YvrE
MIARRLAVLLAWVASAFGAEYRVDPFWPKPLPAPKDSAGMPHQWVTGETGGTCTDAADHVFSINRGWQPGRLGGLLPYEGTTSAASPPVIEFDAEGNVVNSWGGPSLPSGLHGCFVDYQGNIWIGGSADGVVQKWSHDGKQMLLQIGQKGVCDGGQCASPGGNHSQTLLDLPADIAVDPQPDPQTGERGSVYIADGYGNHRIVVFDGKGKYLRQWGEAGSGPGQFAPDGGGHPHCVLLGNDGLLYVCDRNQNRIQIFDRMGKLQRMIAVDPPEHLQSAMRVCDMAFSADPDQSILFVDDVGTEAIWMVDRRTGKLLGSFGHAGHMAGEFTGAHTIAVDSKGNVFVGEAGGGRRTQKFVPR